MEILDEEEKYEDEEALEKQYYTRKSPKAQKLMEKYDALVEKLSQEKNPVKLVMLKFKLNQLQATIQKAIDLEQSKEEYAFRKKDLYNERKHNARLAIEDIASLTYKKRALEGKLRAYEEYDEKSPYFLYDQSIIKSQGGLENILSQLRDDYSIASQETVNKIEEMRRTRKKLERVQDSIKIGREFVHNVEKNYTKDMVKTNIEEMAMTVNNRVNIFQKIGSWFKSGKKVLSETVETRKDMKQLKKEKKEKDQAAREARNRKIEEAMKQYQEEMAKAEEKLKASLRSADKTHSFEKMFNRGYSKSMEKEYKRGQREDSARNYREELNRMTGGVVPTAKPQGSGTQADDQDAKIEPQEQNEDIELF